MKTRHERTHAALGWALAGRMAMGGVALLGAASAFGITAEAQAQRAQRPSRARATPRPTAPAPALQVSAATREKLATGDAQALEEALMELVQVGTPEAARAVAERLERGLPANLALSFVETLGVMGDRASGRVLVNVAITHRHAPVRVAAIRAIQACRPAEGEAAVRARLSDPDAGVRASAALALGVLRDQGAIPSLFQALDRDLYEAAAALASIVTEEHIVRLTGYVGRVPFDVMSPALTELIAREDVPERRKLDLVAQLQELGTAEVKVFLEDLASAIPREGRDARVRQAALDAAMRIVD